MLSNQNLQESSLYKSPADPKTVAGLLVFVLVSLQIYSYVSGMSKKNPRSHTALMILGYAYVLPFVLRLSPEIYSYPVQIFITILIVLLDWFSLHEDKSRFSEEEICIFGNCRYNAKVTGILAHIADTASVALLVYPLLDSKKSKIYAILGFLVYTICGSKIVNDMTKDGSISDLRDKSDNEACRQSRIMRDSWRGGLNDMVTVLGIMVAWQSFLNCNNGNCNASSFPFNQPKGLLKSMYDNDSKDKSWMLLAFKVLLFDVGLTVVPTYMNYINTSFQHGMLPSSLLKIPDCFDDPEDL